MTDLVELCAGTAAVSLAALGAPGFPASRRGSKRGWTGPILEALRVTAPVDHVVLVEIEPRLARLLAALFSRDVLALADEIESRADSPARYEWARAREGDTPADTLLTIAASRGGTRDGGFKGAHSLRASVDGFTPNRHALAERVRAFAPFAGRATVLCVDAALANPEAHAPTSVYLDPPYAGRRGYGETLTDPVGVAKRWAACGHHVAAFAINDIPTGQVPGSERGPFGGSKDILIECEKYGDGPIVSDADREARLVKLFAAHGLNLVFEGEYAPAPAPMVTP